MKMLILAIVALAIITALLKLAASHKTEAKKPPYFKKKTLLNGKEQVLFHQLVEAMPACYIMAQVRLADIVGVKKSEGRQAWFNKISRKSVDFVICDKASTVLACIELDGKTHEQEDRQNADESKDEALNAADIPIIRIEASKLPSTPELKALLEKAVLGKKA